MLYTQAMKDENMTLKPAMKIVGIKSRITMRKYADSGLIPSYWETTNAHSQRRIFKKSDLLAFKAKMVKEPVAGMSYVPLGSPKKPPKKKH